jgi:hypothetical protein
VKPVDPEKQLKGFIGKFDRATQGLIRSVRRALQSRFPTAHELVYDNYAFFVIGYCSTERPSDAILSIVASSNGVGLCFTHGASLPDPKKVLRGSGKQTRSIHIGSAKDLNRPEIETLLATAAARARAPLPTLGCGNLVIRSISAKQRPRQRPQPGKK